MANSDFDFLEAVEADQDSLQRLQALVDMDKELRAQLEELESKVSEVKSSLEKLEQEEIPDLLHQNGLSRIRLKSGEEVKVQPEMQVSVKKENFHDFIEFLRARGEDDIVKLKVQFDRMESEKQKALYAFLNEQSFPYSADNTVHPQTLKKYVKELTGQGKSDYAEGLREGRYVAKEELPNFMRVFEYFKTSIH